MPLRWVKSWVVLCLLLTGAWLLPSFAQARVVVLDAMDTIESSAIDPPAASAAWTPATLPHLVTSPPSGQKQGAAWYRGRFIVPHPTADLASYVVYLPYLYEGGQIWLNGGFVGAIAESSADTIVRWERAHLVRLPAPLLRSGSNEIMVRTAGATKRSTRHFPRVEIGTWEDLQAVYDRRMFWVRTMPQLTVVVCALAAAFSLFIYVRRRSEFMYGLFGVISALWGLRTLTFVIETMPTDDWYLWRLAYHVATGGFIILLTIFSLRLVGLKYPKLETGLLIYWFFGPAWLALAGAQHEAQVNRLWTAGMIPITLSLLFVMVWSTLRRRNATYAVWTVALLLCVTAGLHDYLIAWNVPWLSDWLPTWARERMFLLHLSANVLLLTMAGLLTTRFVRTLGSLENVNKALEDLNQTLETRVAEREQSLAANFERLATLQRQNAASQERQRIMREIHDGLGSRLFTSLLRVERGDLDQRKTAAVLRGCIADMRLALDAMAPDHDFEIVLGNFLFRWQTQMQEAGIESTWSIDVPEESMKLSPQSALQLLQIAQEALTNVLKHAHARHVRVEMRQRATVLELEISDDGMGADLAPGSAGHGIGNMRARAQRLGGRLDLLASGLGTRVLLQFPAVQPSTTIEHGRAEETTV